MFSKTFAVAVALTSVVSAGPLYKRQEPISSSISGGCYTTQPASYPASIYSATVATPVATSIPGGCNPAHPGSCPDSYFSTSVAAPVATLIPGGCNPAHPGSCPDSYNSTIVATPVATSAPSGAPVPAPGSNPVKTDKTWAINNLSRYCGEGNTGCDYNFVIEANGKTERCTIIRTPGKDAATESWDNQPCTAGSPFTISWGYVTQPAPAFAVVTVVNGKELAWLGVSDINGQEVTPSNPFGSGQYPNVSSPVYTYN